MLLMNISFMHVCHPIAIAVAVNKIVNIVMHI